LQREKFYVQYVDVTFNLLVTIKNKNNFHTSKPCQQINLIVMQFKPNGKTELIVAEI